MLEYLRKFDADRFNFVKSNDGFIDHDIVCFDLEMLELSLAEFIELKPTKCLSVKEIRPILQQVCQHVKCCKLHEMFSILRMLSHKPNLNWANVWLL